MVITHYQHVTPRPVLLTHWINLFTGHLFAAVTTCSVGNNQQLLVFLKIKTKMMKLMVSLWRYKREHFKFQVDD